MIDVYSLNKDLNSNLMSALIQRIGGFDHGGYSPEIFSFSSAYEQRHGVSPQTLRPVHKVRVVIPQIESNTEIPETDSLKSNVKNIGFILGALASTVLICVFKYLFRR